MSRKKCAKEPFFTLRAGLEGVKYLAEKHIHRLGPAPKNKKTFAARWVKSAKKYATAPKTGASLCCSSKSITQKGRLKLTPGARCSTFLIINSKGVSLSKHILPLIFAVALARHGLEARVTRGISRGQTHTVKSRTC